MSASEEFVRLVGEEKVLDDVSLEDFAAFSKERAEAVLATTSLPIGVQGKLMKLHAGAQQPQQGTGVEVKCSHCPAKFDTAEQLAAHLEEAHSIEFFGPIVLEHFRLVRRLHISEGSVVFAAVDESCIEKLEVVVKIARSQHGQLELDNEHLLLSGNLETCPGVPVVVAGGNQNGWKILVTSPVGKPIKLFFGENLDKEERARLAQRLSRRLCDILLSVHDRGVLHRDIKPDNLVGSPTCMENLTLIDFGSAIKISEIDSAEHFGTPHYLADCFRETGRSSCRADFESAAWTLHALEEGWRDYEKKEPRALLSSRPSIHEVAKNSLAVSALLDAAPDTSRQRPDYVKSMFLLCAAALLVAYALSAYLTTYKTGVLRPTEVTSLTQL